MHFIAFTFLTLLSVTRLFHAQGAEDDTESFEHAPMTHHEQQAMMRSRETPELLNNMKESNPNVGVSFKLLTQRNGTTICPGDIVSVLIGFENNGSKTLYVTDIVAAMTAPYEPTNYVRNYSVIHHNISVRPNEVHTFEYPFMIDNRINPLEYGLVSVIYYSDSRGNEYSTTVANITMPIADAPGGISTRTFLIIVSLLSSAGVGGYVYRKKVLACGKRMYVKLTTRSSRKSKRRTTSSRSPSSDSPAFVKKTAGEKETDSWITGTPSQKFKKTRNVSPSPAKIEGKRTERGRSPAIPSPLTQ